MVVVVVIVVVVVVVIVIVAVVVVVVCSSRRRSQSCQSVATSAQMPLKREEVPDPAAWWKRVRVWWLRRCLRQWRRGEAAQGLDAFAADVARLGAVYLPARPDTRPPRQFVEEAKKVVEKAKERAKVVEEAKKAKKAKTDVEELILINGELWS